MTAATQKARRDARAELRSNHNDVWIPVDPGDVLDGTVLDVTLAYSEVMAQEGKDGSYPLLRIAIQDATGYADTVDELAVHAMPAVLLNEIVLQEPKPGETIQITYVREGEAKVRGRNAPQIFRVRMPDRDPAEQVAGVYGALKGKLKNRGAIAAPGSEPPADIA